MKRNRVSVSLGRTLNTGQFESLRMDVGVESDVLDGETNDDTFKRLLVEAQKKLEEGLKSTYKLIK